ncbi:hypothetical protein [Ferrigenium sp. UT5]
MPIYDDRCRSSGVQKDVMQKIGEPVLATGPACEPSGCASCPAAGMHA